MRSPADAQIPELAGMLCDCGPCPYRPGRRFLAVHLAQQRVGTAAYRALLDHGFRRSGDHIYRPTCPGCAACVPVRVDVGRFRARKDQRRCRQRNRDLIVDWRPRGFDAERAALFRRYQQAVHGDDPDALDDPRPFLCADAGVDGGELHARDADGTLRAVSVVDRFADGLSSVYCYYDPTCPRRSLGTFMVLAEIAHAADTGLAWLFLGFTVADCGKMAYKTRFRPHQVLDRGRWRDPDKPYDRHGR